MLRVDPDSYREVDTEKCSSGGIGRHAGLKILCSLGRAGSSPASSTKASSFMERLYFLKHTCDLASTCHL
jgi:hypothetical protein